MVFFPEVAIIIPTNFTRNDYLIKTLNSLSPLGIGQVIIVTSKNFDLNTAFQFLDLITNKDFQLRIAVIRQDGSGIANAINFGFKNVNENIRYISWLGDDDYITSSSLIEGVAFLKTNENYVGTFGYCNYISSNDEFLWQNNFGKKSFWLSKIGPNLVPQPGAMFRLSALQKLNFLSEKYNNSFDHDLYLRLMAIGRLKFFHKHFGTFRWHIDSVSVKNRSNLCKESAKVRIANKKNLVTKFLQLLLEPLNFTLVYFAPYFVIRDKKNS